MVCLSYMKFEHNLGARVRTRASIVLEPRANVYTVTSHIIVKVS